MSFSDAIAHALACALALALALAFALSLSLAHIFVVVLLQGNCKSMLGAPEHRVSFHLGRPRSTSFHLIPPDSTSPHLTSLYLLLLRAPLKRSVSELRAQEQQEADAAREMRNIYDAAQTAFVRSQSIPPGLMNAAT